MIGADGISIAQKLTLKEARENFGYSVEEAAKKTGISASRIRKLEKDASSAAIDEFVKLCTYYGTGYNHVYAGAATDVHSARQAVRRTDFHHITLITQLKFRLSELSEIVDTDAMFSRDDISNGIREVFQELHEYEAILLKPFLDNSKNVCVGGRAE